MAPAMSAVMHRQQQQQQHPDLINVTKRKLVYKLVLLDNARNTLERQLRELSEQANVEVQGFLGLPHPSNVQDCDMILRALEAKCNAVEHLLAAFKNLMADPQNGVKSPAEATKPTIQPELSRDKGIMTSDVLKFGPMLQNVLMAGSITKAVQMVGSTLSLHQLKRLVFQNDVFICNISSKQNTVLEASSSSCQDLNKEANNVICEEKTQQNTVVRPQQNNTQDLPRNELKVRSNPIPKKTLMSPLPLGPEHGSDIQVLHRKQTSSQLMQFLRANGKKGCVMEVTLFERRNDTQYTRSFSQTVTLNTQMKNHKINGEDATKDQSCAPTHVLKKELFTKTNNQAPVFKVKRVEAGGSLIYSCMIATKTELWDVGDVFTEVRHSPSGMSATEKEMAQHQSKETHFKISTSSPHPKIQRPQVTEGDLKLDVNSHPQSFQNCSFITSSKHISIPEFRIRKFEEMPVVVTHMVSPGNFYIQNADSNLQQQALITETWKGMISYAELKSIPDIGTLVTGWFPKQRRWCRAQVVKICGMSGDNNTSDSTDRVTNIEVEVKRLDYGDTARISLWNVKELSTEMATLPLQAIQVSLANVTPVDGKDWSQEAVSWFKDMVDNRTLYARLYPQAGKVMVELFMERGKIGAMRRGASLSLRLAQNGHAKHDKLRNVGIKLSSAQERTRKRESAWEKYLIRCYTQNKKKKPC